MANALTIQTLTDGPRTISLKIDGFIDTSNIGSTVIYDPTASPIPGTQCRIDGINWTIQDVLTVSFFFDATTPVRIYDMNGRSAVSYHDVGGILNNSGVGKTGKILMQTTGYTTGVVSFTIKLTMVKQGV